MESIRTADVDGLPVAYREAGRGTPVVLLHGFLCDSRCWRPQLAQLSDQFRVIAWDAPGAGVSADPPDDFTTTSYVDCLAAFLDRLEIDRAHVVGLSWGGILAQEFYRLHASRCRSLILADTYAGWRGSLPEVAWRTRLAECLRDSEVASEIVVAKFMPGIFSDAAPQGLREEFAAIAAEFHPVGFRLMSQSSAAVDTRELLPRITTPTLLLWGSDDRRSPLAVAEQIHSAIPGSQLVVIPNAGHLSNMERPDVFSHHVRRFCLSN